MPKAELLDAPVEVTIKSDLSTQLLKSESMPGGIIAEPPVTPSKKAKRRAFNVAVLAVRRRVHNECEPAPFALIEGWEAPGPFSDSGKPPLCAIRHWTRLVARDVGNRFPDSPEEAMAFIFRNSLAIANAYHRRIVRGDVAAAIAGLFEQSKTDHSIEVSEECSLG